MKPEFFCRADIPAFIDLAQHENWVVEAWELEFLIDSFPEGCLVEREASGKAIAFVTSLLHSRSGWIGNLIVDSCHRGNGLGEKLFLAALKVLQDAGAETIWLTASRMGMKLYEKHGFSPIDTIQRWVGNGSGVFSTATNTPVLPSAAVVSLDALPWGDRREQLLSTVMGRGESIVIKDGFVTLQPCGKGRFQFGPFVALNQDVADGLIAVAQNKIMKNQTIYIDSPVSNNVATLLFKNNSFRVAGSNELMYWGKTPEYHSEQLYGLATMGSCG